MTAADLLRDMTDFVSVDPASIRKAEKLDIDERNSAAFRQVVEDWCEGRYDEDPDYVVTEIEEILYDFEN